jgi:hypothetical protein
MAKFAIEFEEQELEVVFTALDNMKRKVSNPVYVSMARQVQAIVQTKNLPPKKKVKNDKT